MNMPALHPYQGGGWDIHLVSPASASEGPLQYPGRRCVIDMIDRKGGVGGVFMAPLHTYACLHLYTCTQEYTIRNICFRYIGGYTIGNTCLVTHDTLYCSRLHVA